MTRLRLGTLIAQLETKIYLLPSLSNISFLCEHCEDYRIQTIITCDLVLKGTAPFSGCHS